MLNEFLDFCQKTFQLLPADLVMIPICAVLFFCFWKLMGRLMFAPYLALLDQREKAAQEPIDQAQELKRLSASLNAEFEQKYLRAHLEAAEKKKQSLQAAKHEAGLALERARARAQEILGAARSDLGKKAEVLRADLSRETGQFVQSVVERVLNTPSGQ